ncbi:MAG: hypothetical protein WDN30_04885 [Pararobbsia sp.]
MFTYPPIFRGHDTPKLVSGNQGGFAGRLPNAAGESMRNATARLKPGLRSGYVIARFGPLIAHPGIVITIRRNA